MKTWQLFLGFLFPFFGLFLFGSFQRFFLGLLFGILTFRHNGTKFKLGGILTIFSQTGRENFRLLRQSYVWLQNQVCYHTGF